MFLFSGCLVIAYSNKAGCFELNQTGDTYFDLGKYAKAIVPVNGHNLG